MRPITVTTGAYAAGSTTVLAAAQAPVIGTALTLASTTLATPRRLLVTAGADAVTTRTMTLVGTGWDGSSISEVLAIPTGAGATVSSLDYKVLTSATPTGTGWSANVSLGTSATGVNTPMGSSSWVRLDDYGFAPVSLDLDVTGTVNVTVESSGDDPNLVAPQTPVAVGSMVWDVHPNLAAWTTSTHDQYTTAPRWVRLTQNSGAGSAKLIVTQLGGKSG
jgi:hypothetical protein